MLRQIIPYGLFDDSEPLWIVILIVAFIVLSAIEKAAKNNPVKKLTREQLIDEFESLNYRHVSSNSKECYRPVEIPYKNPLFYKEAGDIVRMFKREENFIVFFGMPTCQWCRSVIPTLIKTAKECDEKVIYFINLAGIRDKYKLDDNEPYLSRRGSEDYYELLKILSSVLPEYTLDGPNDTTISIGEKRIYSPTIISVIDGKVHEKITGKSPLQEERDMELTPEIEANINAILTRFFHSYDNKRAMTVTSQESLKTIN